MLKVNCPEIVAKVTAAVETYERALVENDIEALNRLFWESPQALRYGARDQRYSHAEAAQFRRARGPIDQRRTWARTDAGWKIVSAHVSVLDGKG